MAKMTERDIERAAEQAVTDMVSASDAGTADGVAAVLNALSRPVLNAVADLSYVEFDGRRKSSVVADIMNEHFGSQVARVATRLENSLGAADALVMLGTMGPAAISMLAAFYDVPSIEEAPTDALRQEIARRAGWSV